MVDFIEHPLVEDETIESRLYQLKLSSFALSQSSLIVLPTGAGKTTVALLVTAQRLNKKNGRSLFLAPTKPLVEQHFSFYKDAISLDDIQLYTGNVKPKNREWNSRVIIATPQVVENDLMEGKISLKDIVHLTFDECHRATGNYSYNYIAERYIKDAKDPLITGLTASPGSEKEKILEVCENLSIKGVEVLTEDDPLLSEYTHDIDVEWKKVEIPEEVKQARDSIKTILEDRMEKLKNIGILDTARTDVSMDKLLNARKKAQKLIDEGESKGYSALSFHAEVMKLRHAVEVAETQGLDALESYLEKLKREANSSGGSKAAKRLISEQKIQKAIEITDGHSGEHPKKDIVLSLVIDTISNGGRAIVFTEYRETAANLSEFIGEHLDTARFVGQSNKKGDPGMTQKQQKEVLEKFRSGEKEVLVATSVAEEGIDVPEVDLVVFYEPVPSAVRTIQRRGRTGRKRPGRVVVLVAEDTRDEAYFWASKRREENMQEELKELKNIEDEINKELSIEKQTIDKNQKNLEEFSQDIDRKDTDKENIDIVVDKREPSSIRRVLDRNSKLTLETLDVGDFVLSERVAVERKEVKDFISSIKDQRLFEQARELKSNYVRSFFILEGSPEDLYKSGIHPQAIRGALSSLTIDFGISVLFTENQEKTAKLLLAASKREQQEKQREIQIHGEKETTTLPEQQKYVIASIAEVGSVTAESLLKHFNTVENVINASYEELIEVEGIGDKTAKKIREIASTEYQNK